jgi:hypothetical protein
LAGYKRHFSHVLCPDCFWITRHSPIAPSGPRFVPGRKELVYVPGSLLSPEDFWLPDLAAKKNRRLSNFENHSTRTFDITPDGKQIVFNRLKENSDVVQIDLPAKGN